METKIPGTQHFYKIIIPGYKTQLPLPKALCEKLNGKHSEVATITSCKGTWEVKIEQASSELVSFGQGWDVFARQHDLSLGTFVCFEHCGSMHFNAKVYDLTACEKDFPVIPVNPTNKSDKITGEIPTNTSTFDTSGLTIVFTSRDVRQRFIAMYIPKAFAKAHGLDQKKSIILRDSTGEEWPVEVVLYSRKRPVMRKGWSDFCISKQVTRGDSCTFRVRESPDRCEFVVLEVCISHV